MVGSCAGERAFLVAEERGLGELAAERGAVHVHELPTDLSVELLKLVYLVGELALACAGRSRKEDRIGGSDSNPLDGLDESVERLVPGLNALLEEREIVLSFYFEALCELVVTGQVEVDDAACSLGVVRVSDMSFFRRGLDELAGKMAGFRQQEETDLLHMRAGRHVDVVLRLLLVEAGTFGVVVEFGVDFFEVPGVLELDDVEHDFRLRRYGVDVAPDPFGQRLMLRVEDEVELVDSKIVLLDESDVRTPGVPAARAVSAVCVFLGAENGNDCRFHGG